MTPKSGEETMTTTSDSAVNVTGVLFETDAETQDGGLAKDITPLQSAGKRKYELVWFNIIVHSYAHVASVYGLWLLFTFKWQTIVFSFISLICSLIGITAGAHRLWSHRSYKANLPLRLLIIFFNTMAFQGSAFTWARDHRLHHKYSETDADPYNSQRGFFFAHIGWMNVKKHPAIAEKSKGLDFSDLHQDRVLMFQHKNCAILMPIFCYLLPTIVPMFGWGETLRNAWHSNLLRWVISLHLTFLINSSAHMFGMRPYDKSISPTNERILMFLRTGEGYHNYHHTFPWDYKNAEFGNYANDIPTYFIQFFAWLGWAYDLKSVPLEMVKRRVQRTGDGSHPVWGWGDKDEAKDDIDGATITYRKRG